MNLSSTELRQQEQNLNSGLQTMDSTSSPAIGNTNVSSIPSLGLSACQKIAVDICYILQPFCEKINIAGSVRRKKKEPKDIEIICIPKKEILKDMFGRDEGVIVDLQFQKEVEQLGEIIKGKTDGKYMQIKLPQGINLDLFMPDDFDYYRQYAIRTGSADYAFKIIANGWKKKGWCGSNKGLRKISDCIEIKGSDGKSKWNCVKANAELPPVWQSEEQFFEWLGIKYLPPNRRNI